MSENNPPPNSNPSGGKPTTTSAAADVPGQPFYDKTRAHLRTLLHKRRELEAKLQSQEADILRKETEYLEDTPHGNIIIGFDAYTKGVSVVPGQRRRLVVVEGNRVFSRSSVSFGNGGDSPMDTAQSTPVAAMAPTPLSTSFLKGDGGSNHATPTSATSANKTGAGGAKKNKKGAGAAAGAGATEDSDTDTRDSKKARTNFGAVGRK
ncbi:histone acetyltransferase subunit NuA4-domain-containing protein [Leptodontidium sp. 2 PMI_412]|nr:histone acetyltransferase subunit NuA4-domain-containing protein [Leptodontidium sp. MPI-SDFR-AT-0119]KAH9210698.1 histone acetyltransferase subunit NuA4-domain-containing protein [Leptodontidium sp. 2 PMI_412]